jgi:hypothetical protein
MRDASRPVREGGQAGKVFMKVLTRNDALWVQSKVSHLMSNVSLNV